MMQRRAEMIGKRTPRASGKRRRPRGRQLTISIATDKNGTIAFSELIEKLDAVRDALRETSRILLSEAEWKYEYRVISLSRTSPYKLKIEECAVPRGKAGREKQAKRATEPPSPGRALVKNIRSIEGRGVLPGNVDVPALETYRELGPDPKQNVSYIRLAFSGGESVSITRSFDARIERLLGEDVLAEGYIDGRLELLDLHRKYRFAIFPTVGPKKVLCDFEPELQNRVIAPLAQRGYVRVKGILKYKTGFPYPYAVIVRDIQPLPEATSLVETRGIAPDATGGVDAAEFVDTIRDGW